MLKINNLVSPFQEIEKNESIEESIDIIECETELQKIGNQILCMGPKLQLDRADGCKKIEASVLIVTEGDHPEDLHLNVKRRIDDVVKVKTIQPILLERIENYSAWVFPFSIGKGKDFFYQLNNEGKEYHVCASKKDKFDAAAFSCNGRQTLKEQNEYEKLGGLSSAWKNVVKTHKDHHLTHLISLGDTIYMDDFFENLPQFAAFKKLSLKKKYHAPFTEDMRMNLRKYFFEKYCKHFSIPEFRDLMAQLFCIFMWDDHDIMDGAGSYDEELRNCPVYRGIFEEAYRAFLIFQQHTNLELRDQAGFIGKGCNKLFHLGPVTILNLDTRFERTINQVLSEESRDAIKEALDKPFPKECKHLIVNMGIPMSFPSLAFLEQIFHIEHEILKEYLANYINSPPELLDDLRDEWRSPGHAEERLKWIELLIEIIMKHLEDPEREGEGIRLTLVSGDVHFTSVSKFFDPAAKNPKNDPKNITNFITSPIGNKSPKIMRYVLRLFNFNEMYEEVIPGIYSRVVEFIRVDSEEPKKIITQQNWLRLKYDPLTNNLVGYSKVFKYPSTASRFYDDVKLTTASTLNWCSTRIFGKNLIQVTPNEKGKTFSKTYKYVVLPLEKNVEADSITMREISHSV